MTTRLSKSRCLSGFQCHKRLYLEIHARELASERDEGTQAVLDTGTRVGELARKRYPGGVLVDVEYFKAEEGIDRTGAILAAPCFQPAARRSGLGTDSRPVDQRRHAVVFVGGY